MGRHGVASCADKDTIFGKQERGVDVLPPGVEEAEDLVL
jgi:hypothetical protein